MGIAAVNRIESTNDVSARSALAMAFVGAWDWTRVRSELNFTVLQGDIDDNSPAKACFTASEAGQGLMVMERWPEKIR